MNEGWAVLGARATWALQHSAMPDAPVVPDAPARERRGVALVWAARTLRRAAELLDPRPERRGDPGPGRVGDGGRTALTPVRAEHEGVRPLDLPA
ncbi:hypothetical protein ACWFNE_09680 [Cellulomonas sp. NPDC055163]